MDNTKIISINLIHTILKTAVGDIEELRAVQNVLDQVEVLSGKSQTYEEYCSFLVLETITYDDNRIPKPFFSRQNNNTIRSIYQHDVYFNHDDSWGEYNNF